MKLRNLFLGLALGLSLTACAGSDTTKTAAYTCTSTAALIDVAAEANRAGKIKPEDKIKISNAINKVAVVCENPIAPTTATMKQAAVDELVQLLVEKAGVKL